MKDFQDSFYDDQNELNNETNQINKETGDDTVAMDQNIEESVSENEESICQVSEEREEKEGHSCQKAEADSPEGQNREEEIPSIGKGNPTDGEDLTEEDGSSENYSCSYKPPYYVPDFTVIDEKVGEANKRKNGGKSRAWLIGLAALVVALALLGGVFIGLRVGLNERASNENDSSSLGGANGTVTVIKNDSPIQVSVEIDSGEANAMSIEQVVDRVANTVVEIVTTRVQTGMFGYGQYVTDGAGSGVLIDKEGRGYIVTNYHVIGDSPEQTAITVRLTNGTEYEAEYVAGDAQHDIAILKINATGLPYAVMGSSANLKVGQGVVAIGNPLGELGGTVTNGIISAKDRQVIVDGNRMTLLQTNAEINPGNSGGGLFDMAGRLIGIVNAKQSATGIEGLGFAIPIDVAWQVASDLIQYGYVTNQIVLPFFAEYRDDLTVSVSPFTTQSMPKGVYIMQSNHGELKPYDLIVSMNGREIESMGDYYYVIDQLKKGDTLSITVKRLVGGGFSEYTVSFVSQFTEVPNKQER